MNASQRAQLRKRTGNTLRNLPHSDERNQQLVTDATDFNPNKNRNWERVVFEGQPVIYHAVEHRFHMCLERYGWGLNLQTGQWVRMSPYRLWTKERGILPACLIGLTNYHFARRDKTHNPQFWHANQARKLRRNDKNSHKHEIRNQIRQTLNDSEYPHYR